jgi:ribosomal protein L11 methyltransferase
VFPQIGSPQTLNSWFELSVHVPISKSDRISSILFDLGSSGLEVDDTSRADSVELKAYFSAESGRETVMAALNEALVNVPGDARVVDIVDVPDEDWGAKWREHFEPIYPTKRMVIHPPWCDVQEPEDGFTVAIEPKMAFGTGSHPTTKMALLALERVIRPGDRLLDVGTGSGILSIAAIRLGATSSLAVDTDPVATENVQENIGLNGVSGIKTETRRVSGDDTGYDVTVANIIRNVLTPMLPQLAASVRSNGHVILGGLLDREESEFSEAAREAGLTILEVTREAEWIGLITKVAG